MPFDPPFSGYIQPPGVPPDPTGDCWRGPAGPPGPPGPAADVTNSPVTATGSTAPRYIPDRFADWVNVKDFGAKIDGTTQDGPAIGAALASLQPHESLFVPGGNSLVTWGLVQGTTPATPVLIRLDGTLSGGTRPNRAFSRNNMGDMFDTYYNGGKFLSVMSAKPDQPPMLRLEYSSQAPGGTTLSTHLPLFITCQDNADALTGMWGIGVAMTSYANVNDPVNNWPQQVGISSSLHKYGKAWCAGMHITAQDHQNLPSSQSGTLLGMEIGYHVNGADDGGVPGMAGLRYGVHLSMSASTPVASGGLLAEYAAGFQVDGTNDSVIKSCFVVTGIQSYQVFDARTATAPPGYAYPVAALRMDPGQIIDFNGANTVLNTPGWVGPPGNYLQYTTAGTPRLRYMDAAVELLSISDAGRLTFGVLPINAANDAAATSAGVPVGGVYRNGSVLMVRVA